MTNEARRLNIVLDDESAAKLWRLAERTHTNPGTLARSMLASAIDEADPDARNITAVLDAIPGAWEQAERGRAELRAGSGVPLEEL